MSDQAAAVLGLTGFICCVVGLYIVHQIEVMRLRSEADTTEQLISNRAWEHAVRLFWAGEYEKACKILEASNARLQRHVEKS